MKRLTVALAATALALAGCSSAGDGGDREAGTVKIGLVGPETGGVPQYYTDLIRPVELAVEQLAEKYDLEVEIVSVDDQATPDGASGAVQQLLNDDDVDAIFGPPLSGNALQVADVIQRTGRPWFIPAISPEVMNEDLDPNWAFRTNYNSADLSQVVAELLFADEATVGVVHSADAYGQSGLDSINAEAEELGEEVAAEVAIQPGTTDFSSGIAELKDAGVDTVFLAITAGADTSTVTKAIVQEELAPDLVVTNATILADFATLADPEQWENLVFVDSRDLTGENLATMSEQYEEEFGEPPLIPTNVHTVMAAVDAYLQAVKEAGDARDFDAVREALESLDSISVGDDVYEQPFAEGDHELYEADDAASWYVFGFAGDGSLENRGDLASCIDAGC